MKDPSAVHNSRNRSPSAAASVDDLVSQHTGFVFEEDETGSPTPKATPATPVLPLKHRYNLPKRNIIMDQWAALGERRRAAPTPTKETHPLGQTTPTDGAFGAIVPPRKRNRAGSWRRNLNWLDTKDNNSNNVVVNKEPWSVSKDWRMHPTTPTPEPPVPQQAEKRGFEWVFKSALLHM
jgi:hypothetical protein